MPRSGPHRGRARRTVAIHRVCTPFVVPKFRDTLPNGPHFERRCRNRSKSQSSLLDVCAYPIPSKVRNFCFSSRSRINAAREGSRRTIRCEDAETRRSGELASSRDSGSPACHAASRPSASYISREEAARSMWLRLVGETSNGIFCCKEIGRGMGVFALIARSVEYSPSFVAVKFGTRSALDGFKGMLRHSKAQ
jgi:hypothetical protein